MHGARTTEASPTERQRSARLVSGGPFGGGLRPESSIAGEASVGAKAGGDDQPALVPPHARAQRPSGRTPRAHHSLISIRPGLLAAGRIAREAVCAAAGTPHGHRGLEPRRGARFPQVGGHPAQPVKQCDPCRTLGKRDALIEVAQLLQWEEGLRRTISRGTWHQTVELTRVFYKTQEYLTDGGINGYCADQHSGPGACPARLDEGSKRA